MENLNLPLQIQMNRTIIAVLLMVLAISQATVLTSLDISKPAAAGCQTTTCKNDGGSLPVNQQIIVATSQTIAPPACVVPQVTAPVINVPNIPTPNIQVPRINIPLIQSPPTFVPPTVNIPTVQPPVLNLPSLPPQVQPPTVKPILPVPPVIALPPRPPANCIQVLSNQFTFIFQYACRQGVPFQSCLGQIVWNNVIVYSINPSDYNVRTVTLTLTVFKGRNLLQIAGAGVSDGYGLTIDNVRLVRQGTNANIVVNGDFEAPNQYGAWHIYDDITGWQGSGIEIGQGTIYNDQWISQVAELDSKNNYQITQTFTFDSFYQLVSSSGVSSCNNPFPGSTLSYTLEFDWAPRTVGFSNLDSSKADVLWNNVVIGSLVSTSTNQGVNHATFIVTLSAGDNLLQFDGTSFSDSYGITIDNVKLTSIFNSTNLIANGDFSRPALSAGQYTFVNGGIAGWIAAKAEIGDCRNYNSEWAAGQCLQLDSDSNQRYTQVITVPQSLYTSLVLYIKSRQGDLSVLSSVNEAIRRAQNQVSTVVANINSAVQCSISLTAGRFNHYIQKLYQCSQAAIKNVKDDQLLNINQYSTTSSEWIKYFGPSGQLDFTCEGYSEKLLAHKWCTIIAIKGKKIHCKDNAGQYHLQFAPCSHFDGHRPLPIIGDKIFWKGSQSSAGPVNIIVATTCDC